MLRVNKNNRLNVILSEFRGLKDIATIGSSKRKECVPTMTDDNGVKHYSQEGIAEVFASFYEKLYRRKLGRATDRHQTDGMTLDSIAPFSLKEFYYFVLYSSTLSFCFA